MIDAQQAVMCSSRVKDSKNWFSKKQPIVTLSTAEADNVALSYATQEATWIQRLLYDSHVLISTPMVTIEDNQGAISITKTL